MILSIVVKPNAKKEQIEEQPDGSYRVSVNVSPIEGRANDAVIRILADHFSVPKSAVRIVRGAHGKRKWVEVGESK